jgi:hypothetical protein
MIVNNTFELGPEGWSSYDYHQSVVQREGKAIMVLTTHQKTGGIDDKGYVWTNEHVWTPDIPETPVSILPLIIYRNWTNEEPVDLRDTKVTVSLRGDGLELEGAECYFWVVCGMTRWHMNSEPFEIVEGAWPTSPATIQLTSDETLWHRSWSKDPSNAISLDDCLKNCVSYGFSFVGSTSAVRGKLSLGGFKIE